jgi:ribosome-associated toxin RatA of RatAB toxin-antitoxin module
MHRVERSVLVPYPPAKMFDLIADVPGYPRFLPWCSAAQLQPLGDVAVEATIEIAYRGVRSRFTTRNQLDRPQRIGMALVDGPFQRLDGAWSFAALGDSGCRAQLLLEYDFVAGPLGLAIRPVFDALAGSLIDAFVREADARHG